jgi:hypothetical protein
VLTLKLLVTHLGDGRTTQLVVAEGTETSSIFAVKQRIEEVEGIKVETQRLIRLRHEDGGNENDGNENDCIDEMADNIVLHASCTLNLLVGEARFGWDPRTAHEISEYVQTDRRTYTRRQPLRSGDDDVRVVFPLLGHHMSIYPPIMKQPCAHGNCFHLSMRFQVDHDHDIRVYCGVQEGGTWFHEPRGGAMIPARSVLTMRLDVFRRTLECFVDGVPFRSTCGGPSHCIAFSTKRGGQQMTWGVLGPPEVSAYEIVECEHDLVTIKD